MSESDQRINILTVSSVAVIVYFLCCFLHEAGGHGGVATLLDVKVTRVTNAYCSQRDATEMQGRIIASAGILLNAIVGFTAIFIRSKLQRHENGVLHYFIWLFAHMNLLSASGYMASFAFLRIGDLHAVVHDLPQELVIRILIFVVGLGLIIWTFFHAGRTLGEFAGQGEDRVRRARVLTFVPYIVGGVVNVAMSLLGVGSVPVGIVLISSVGASFGGNFPLLWISYALPPPREPSMTKVLTPIWSFSWMIVGLIFLGLYAVLGRGINF